MSTRGTLHLISGLPCTGKSTYAEHLKHERDAALLSLDRWLITAFGRYTLDVAGYVEHARRLYACRELIWSVAAELLRRGADVILDDGFFRRRDREHHIALARAIGVDTTIHFIDTPVEIVRAQLTARNSNPGEYHFDITPEVLDACVGFFEPPSDDEGANLVIVRRTTAS